MTYLISVFSVYTKLETLSINILIAVASDFESAIRAGSLAGGWWMSSEGVWLYGGWWNVLNGLAGLFNIVCMTGWWDIYSSKDKKDMLWPDMIWVYVLAYDIWNFQYTYLNLPTHSWYCGLALLLAPTFAAALWNKGGWIQNRANTLALWCMFAQVFPLFQDASRFTTVTSVYGEGGIAAAMGLRHTNGNIGVTISNIRPECFSFSLPLLQFQKRFLASFQKIVLQDKKRTVCIANRS